MSSRAWALASCRGRGWAWSWSWSLVGLMGLPGERGMCWFVGVWESGKESLDVSQVFQLGCWSGVNGSVLVVGGWFGLVVKRSGQVCGLDRGSGHAGTDAGGAMALLLGSWS